MRRARVDRGAGGAGGARGAAETIEPGQRIDLKVLLISADGSEPGFGAWKAQLQREGVPFDTFVAYDGQTKAATLTDSRLADYAGNRASYQALILASGDLGHTVTNPDGRRQLPLRLHGRRVGDPGEVRAQLRRPAPERLHRHRALRTGSTRPGAHSRTVSLRP